MEKHYTQSAQLSKRFELFWRKRQDETLKGFILSLTVALEEGYYIFWGGDLVASTLPSAENQLLSPLSRPEGQRAETVWMDLAA